MFSLHYEGWCPEPFVEGLMLGMFWANVIGWPLGIAWLVLR